MDPPSPALTVREATSAFLETLAARSSRTRATYSSALRRFHEYLADVGQPADISLTTRLGPDVLELYYGWLVKNYGASHRATVVTYVAAARAFFRFLDRRRLAAGALSYQQMRDNLQEVMGRVPYRTPRVDRRLASVVLYVKSLPVPDKASGSLRQRLQVLRDKALLLTLYCTGMRREEVSRLSRSDIDDGWARQALITGKGDRERVVFFDLETLEAIKTYLQARGDHYSPLFLRHDKGRGRPGKGGESYRLSPQSVWAIVKHHSRMAGVEASPHSFRHSKASVMLNRGAKLSEVQDILGHASPETTKRIYAHYEVSHLREVFDRFSVSAEELAAQVASEGGPDPRLDPGGII